MCHDNRETKDTGSSAWRDESWGDCARRPVTVLTWRAVEDRSRYEDRRLETLGHRWLTCDSRVRRTVSDDDEAEGRCCFRSPRLFCFFVTMSGRLLPWQHVHYGKTDLSSRIFLNRLATALGSCHRIFQGCGTRFDIHGTTWSPCSSPTNLIFL